MHESIVFCSTCTMSSYRKFTFAISSADEFLVKYRYRNITEQISNSLSDKPLSRHLSWLCVVLDLKFCTYQPGMLIGADSLDGGRTQAYVNIFISPADPEPDQPRRSAPQVHIRIGTVRYAEGLWRMRRHGPVIAHCTDSEDLNEWKCTRFKVHSKAKSRLSLTHLYLYNRWAE